MIDLSFVQDAIDFFGCGSHKVNPILLRIGMREDRPEWLRHRPKLQQLPRWTPNGEHLVPTSKRTTVPLVAERLIWIVDELQGGWCLTTEGFIFEDAREAVHFKLMWS